MRHGLEGRGQQAERQHQRQQLGGCGTASLQADDAAAAAAGDADCRLIAASA